MTFSLRVLVSSYAGPHLWGCGRDYTLYAYCLLSTAEVSTISLSLSLCFSPCLFPWGMVRGGLSGMGGGRGSKWNVTTATDTGGNCRGWIERLLGGGRGGGEGEARGRPGGGQGRPGVLGWGQVRKAQIGIPWKPKQ